MGCAWVEAHASAVVENIGEGKKIAVLRFYTLEFMRSCRGAHLLPYSRSPYRKPWVLNLDLKDNRGKALVSQNFDVGKSFQATSGFGCSETLRDFRKARIS